MSDDSVHVYHPGPIGQAASDARHRARGYDNGWSNGFAAGRVGALREAAEIERLAEAVVVAWQEECDEEFAYDYDAIDDACERLRDLLVRRQQASSLSDYQAAAPVSPDTQPTITEGELT